MPTKIFSIDLSQELPISLEGVEKYERVWLIAFYGGIPINLTIINNHFTPVYREQIRRELVRQLETSSQHLAHQKLLNHFLNRNLSVDTDLGSALTAFEFENLLPELQFHGDPKFTLTIVVCTRDRPDDLRKCLESLINLRTEGNTLEILVVDNNPTSGQTPEVVNSFPNVSYVAESRPGVAYARNKGLKEASSEIVAFIDDDVIVPKDWVRRILAPFADNRVMCVSGLVLPAELEYPSQELFELYGALGRGYVPRIFDSKFFNHSKKHVVTTWDLGGTANVAIRKKVIQETGMFDETLGPGLPSGVGEDIYMFYRLLKLGHLCYYEPAAYVWHKHRTTIKTLKHQLYNYHKGQVSYQLRTLITDGDKRARRQLLWDLPVWHFERLIKILRGRLDYPLSLMWEEARGTIVGPYAFYKSVKLHNQLNGPGTNPINPSILRSQK